MSEKAELGLVLDLAGWRNDIRRAGNMVKTGIGKNVLRPFDTAVRRSFLAFKAGVGGIARGIRRLGSVIFSLPSLLATLGLVGLISKLTDARDLARDFADSVTRIQNAADGSGIALDLPNIQDFITDLSEVSGKTETELNGVFSRFRNRFNDKNSSALTSLTADVAAQFGIELKQAARIVDEASQGRTDSLNRIGVTVKKTGDAAKDAESAIAALYAQANGAAAAITNPSERLAAEWDRMKVQIGEGVLPALDSILNIVTNVLALWDESDVESGMAKIVEFATMIGVEGLRIIETIIALGGVLQDTVALAFAFVDDRFTRIKTAITVLIPALVKGLMAEVLKIIDKTLDALPGGKEIKKVLGIGDAIKDMAMDLKQSSNEGIEEFTDKNKVTQKTVEDLAQTRKYSIENLIDIKDGRRSPLREYFNKQNEEGQAIRDKRRADAQAATQGVKFQELVNVQSQDQTNQKKTLEAAMRANAQESSSVSVKIVSSRPEKFRKARSR